MEAAFTKIKGGVQERLQAIGSKYRSKLAPTSAKVAKKRAPNPVLEGIISQRDWDAFEKWLTNELAGVYLDGALVAAAQMSVTTELTNEYAVKWAAARSGELIKDISRSTMDSVADLMAQGTAEGWSNAELSDAMEEGWGWSEARCDTIARTETAFADIAGNRALYAESGMVTKVQWVMADSDVCDICEELDGKELDIDAGEEELPPAHPNCRCDILPILDEEQSADQGEKMVKVVKRMTDHAANTAVAALTFPLESLRVDMSLLEKTMDELEKKPVTPRVVTITRDENGRVIGARIQEEPNGE